ncbi:NAD(P)-dependent oxidoreductase [Azorhizobium oxalatiphilum]|uniref:NAD(P)-dependent oxidoreductase n=1 Tax=Azorhizobium oxalatiphilum TaxID=980631 RepID=A0A917C7W5_9HYPH|nr:SDR family oxidoreductase [Azorhizobium oxalatiphilum]GGF75870.1 NAD(P)-dependent oxidoreductase [Azorhizobium oxalatiphilum]
MSHPPTLLLPIPLLSTLLLPSPGFFATSEGMTTLLAVGLGYCTRHLLATHPDLFDRVIGTARTPEGVAALEALGVEGVLFDGLAASPALRAAVAEAHVLVLSAPPGEAGDPLLAVAEADIAASHNLQQILYLTTLGVYGDHDGGWVDETTPPRAGSARLERRLKAEAGLLALGVRKGIPVASLRLAGIYGPGRNAFLNLKAGEARRIDKPGQVFNRIHVADIATSMAAVIGQGFSGLLNVTDDRPAPPGDPIAFAAGLMGVEPPPLLPFAEVAQTMSPMALSFWAGNKRVRNTRLKEELGVTLAYPTFEDGLGALYGEMRDAGEI